MYIVYIVYSHFFCQIILVLRDDSNLMSFLGYLALKPSSEKSQLFIFSMEEFPANFLAILEYIRYILSTKLVCYSKCLGSARYCATIVTALLTTTGVNG